MLLNLVDHEITGKTFRIPPKEECESFCYIPFILKLPIWLN